MAIPTLVKKIPVEWKTRCIKGHQNEDPTKLRINEALEKVLGGNSKYLPATPASMISRQRVDCLDRKPKNLLQVQRNPIQICTLSKDPGKVGDV